MKEIPLTQGQVAIVDECDAHLAEWKWCAVNLRGVYYAKRDSNTALHQAILGRPINRKFVIDHINGNTLDNRRSNLRFATARDNCVNRQIHRRGHVPGVTWSDKDKKWFARIRVNGRKLFLGCFDSEKEAGCAYQGAVRVLESISENQKEPTELSAVASA